MNNYNKPLMESLFNFIKKYNGISDKQRLSCLVKQYFGLVEDRSVFYCEHFAIRFSQAKSKNMANTVLSLSALQKYDEHPFIVCIVTPVENIILLANTTCLSKISHSSQELRVDNIKGSFNGSDIMKNVVNLLNVPENIENIFLLHENFTFTENLERLVEKTNQIAPTGIRFMPNSIEMTFIANAPLRAKEFLESTEYIDLKNDLDNRVKLSQTEIAIAAFIDNVNIRGRIIEYLITSNGGSLKAQIVECLHNKKPFPQFITEDGLGDYSKSYKKYDTETEIKTKILFLASNPKAYNIDKLLQFLAKEKSVYMIYIVGITDNGKIKVALCSVFDKVLIKGTVSIKHWAGRNSRGVTQFYGNSLISVLNNQENEIDVKAANEHIEAMLLL